MPKKYLLTAGKESLLTVKGICPIHAETVQILSSERAETGRKRAYFSDMRTYSRQDAFLKKCGEKYHSETNFDNFARPQFLRLECDVETSVELKQMLHR